MTEAEIVFEVISKAHKNGYLKFGNNAITVQEIQGILFVVEEDSRDGMKMLWSIDSIIFSHYFAKALWGEKDVCVLCGETSVDSGESHNSNGDDYWANCAGCGAEWMSKLEFSERGNYLPCYLYHLQEMVLYLNPIQYLAKFL